jgi:sulfur carrier protein
LKPKGRPDAALHARRLFLHQAGGQVKAQRMPRYNRTMDILLNGERRELAGDCTLAQLLDEAGYAGRRVAVEVNREIVPRSRHAGHRLADGDRVEIVHAIGGG